MNNQELTCQLGFAKVEAFRRRLTPTVLSSFAGQVVWVHNEFACAKINKDKSSIQKAIKAGGISESNRQASLFAESIARNEVRYLNSHPDEFLVLASTPYGLYLSFIAPV